MRKTLYGAEAINVIFDNKSGALVLYVLLSHNYLKNKSKGSNIVCVLKIAILIEFLNSLVELYSELLKDSVCTSSSSSPGWKAPVVLRPMSAWILRPPSPLRRPPEPLEDMELEELRSRGLLTVGNCGRL